jgi:nucleoside-diphosphate-sugar epimerase
MLGARHYGARRRSITMAELDSLHVVFGGTGAIGGAVVTELVRAGRDVRAVSRGGQAPDGAQGVAADVSDPARAARAAAGASVIYHCASPPYTRWPELFPALTRSILDAAESSGAKLVFADNLYAYGPVDGPLREDLAAVAHGPKGKIRVEMAAQLLAAHRNGQARVVIGRASDYYGPHGTGSTAGETVFGRILAGNKPQWTGRLDQPHTFHYLPDIARGLLVLADRREADGQVWHLPAAGPLTAQQFFDMIAKAAGQPVPVHASIASPALLAVAGILSPLLREMRETTYQFRAPFVIDASKFEAAFGHLEPTSHHDAVQRTVAWYRSR